MHPIRHHMNLTSPYILCRELAAEIGEYGRTPRLILARLLTSLASRLIPTHLRY